jgi:hypothetical protein
MDEGFLSEPLEKGEMKGRLCMGKQLETIRKNYIQQ